MASTYLQNTLWLLLGIAILSGVLSGAVAVSGLVCELVGCVDAGTITYTAAGTLLSVSLFAGQFSVPVGAVAMVVCVSRVLGDRASTSETIGER